MPKRLVDWEPGKGRPDVPGTGKSEIFSFTRNEFLHNIRAALKMLEVEGLDPQYRTVTIRSLYIKNQALLQKIQSNLPFDTKFKGILETCKRQMQEFERKIAERVSK